jgi:hypothetical protein
LIPAAWRRLCRAHAGLAPALLLSGVVTGCINPIWELETLDPDMNTPPQIVPELLSPPVGVDPVDADIGDGCAQETFRATVVDFDGDQLFFKFLMKGRLGQVNEGRVLERQLASGQLTPSDASLDEILGAGASDRFPDGKTYPPLELTLSPEQLLAGFDSPSSLAGSNKTHLLSLFVSDRNFGQDPTNTVPLVPEGEPAVLPARTSWQLRILESDCAGLP